MTRLNPSLPRFILDISNKRFGRIVTKSFVRLNDKRRAIWNCICDCGVEKDIQSALLTSGKTKSCGCLRIEVGKKNATHGMYKTKEHTAWQSMNNRCKYECDISYKNYGGRGIKVCEEWKDFSNFYRDMGQAPEGTSLDRINVELGYFPGNCRWATAEEQANNKRCSVKLTIHGKTMTIMQWANETGIYPGTLYKRFHKGTYSPEQLIEKGRLNANQT